LFYMGLSSSIAHLWQSHIGTKPPIVQEFSHEDVTVAIDETPVGVFIEIEGSEEGITTMAEALGRGPSDYILDSYRGLFLQSGRGGRDMVFDPSE